MTKVRNCVASVVVLLSWASCMLPAVHAQNAEKIDRLQTFIDRNRRTMSTVEVESYLRALINLDEQYAQAKLDAAPEGQRIEVMRQLVREVPETPTGQRLVELLDELDEANALAAFEKLKEEVVGLSPPEAIATVNRFLSDDQHGGFDDVKREAMSLNAELRVPIAEATWKDLQGELQLDQPDIKSAKLEVDEQRAAEAYKYASNLIYGRDRNLRELVEDYPNTRAAKQAEQRIASESESDPADSRARSVRDFWDAVYPGRLNSEPR